MPTKLPEKTFITLGKEEEITLYSHQYISKYSVSKELLRG